MCAKDFKYVVNFEKLYILVFKWIFLYLLISRGLVIFYFILFFVYHYEYSSNGSLTDPRAQATTATDFFVTV